MKRAFMLFALALSACQQERKRSWMDGVEARLAAEQAAKTPEQRKAEDDAARANYDGLQQMLAEQQAAENRQRLSDDMRQVLIQQTMQSTHPQRVDIYVHSEP